MEFLVPIPAIPKSDGQETSKNPSLTESDTLLHTQTLPKLFLQHRHVCRCHFVAIARIMSQQHYVIIALISIEKELFQTLQETGDLTDNIIKKFSLIKDRRINLI